MNIGIYMCDEEGNEWIDKNTYNSLYEEKERLNKIINKAIEIYENKETIKYKMKKFLESKNTSDLMYEALKGVNKE